MMLYWLLRHPVKTLSLAFNAATYGLAALGLAALWFSPSVAKHLAKETLGESWLGKKFDQMAKVLGVVAKEPHEVDLAKCSKPGTETLIGKAKRGEGGEDVEILCRTKPLPQ